MGASVVVVGSDSTGAAKTGAAKTGGSGFFSLARTGKTGAGFSSDGVEGLDLVFPSFFLIVKTLLTESKILDLGRSVDLDEGAVVDGSPDMMNDLVFRKDSVGMELPECVGCLLILLKPPSFYSRLLSNLSNGSSK